MKKVIASMLSLMLVLALSVSVFATGGFVSSPALDKAPTVKDFTAESENCATDIVVTAYADRADLNDNSKTAMETAYSEIQAATDVTTLSADLTKVATDMNVEAKNLAVSDLFDLSQVGCDDHTDHKAFQIKLSADTLKNFVALLHKTANGWEVVADAKVENGDTLAFSVDSLSPFAIVVDAGETGNASTGDNANLPLYISLMAVSAVALVVVIVLYKKKKSN